MRHIFAISRDFGRAGAGSKQVADAELESADYLQQSRCISLSLHAGPHEYPPTTRPEVCVDPLLLSTGA